MNSTDGTTSTLLPIGLILRGDDLPGDIIDAAFALAGKRAATLVVAQSCPRSLAQGLSYGLMSWESTRQELLDTELTAWQEKYPRVGVVAEIRWETFEKTLRLFAETCQVVLVASQ
jgi:hypothetical protein